MKKKKNTKTTNRNQHHQKNEDEKTTAAVFKTATKNKKKHRRRTSFRASPTSGEDNEDDDWNFSRTTITTESQSCCDVDIGVGGIGDDTSSSLPHNGVDDQDVSFILAQNDDAADVGDEHTISGDESDASDDSEKHQHQHNQNTQTKVTKQRHNIDVKSPSIRDTNGPDKSTECYGRTEKNGNIVSNNKEKKLEVSGEAINTSTSTVSFSVSLKNSNLTEIKSQTTSASSPSNLHQCQAKQQEERHFAKRTRSANVNGSLMNINMNQEKHQVINIDSTTEDDQDYKADSTVGEGGSDSSVVTIAKHQTHSVSTTEDSVVIMKHDVPCASAIVVPTAISVNDVSYSSVDVDFEVVARRTRKIILGGANSDEPDIIDLCDVSTSSTSAPTGAVVHLEEADVVVPAHHENLQDETDSEVERIMCSRKRMPLMTFSTPIAAKKINKKQFVSYKTLHHDKNDDDVNISDSNSQFSSTGFTAKHLISYKSQHNMSMDSNSQFSTTSGPDNSTIKNGGEATTTTAEQKYYIPLQTILETSSIGKNSPKENNTIITKPTDTTTTEGTETGASHHHDKTMDLTCCNLTFPFPSNDESQQQQKEHDFKDDVTNKTNASTSIKPQEDERDAAQSTGMKEEKRPLVLPSFSQYKSRKFFIGDEERRSLDSSSKDNSDELSRFSIPNAINVHKNSNIVKAKPIQSCVTTSPATTSTTDYVEKELCPSKLLPSFSKSLENVHHHQDIQQTSTSMDDQQSSKILPSLMQQDASSKSLVNIDSQSSTSIERKNENDQRCLDQQDDTNQNLEQHNQTSVSLMYDLTFPFPPSSASTSDTLIAASDEVTDLLLKKDGVFVQPSTNITHTVQAATKDQTHIKSITPSQDALSISAKTITSSRNPTEWGPKEPFLDFAGVSSSLKQDSLDLQDNERAAEHLQTKAITQLTQQLSKSKTTTLASKHYKRKKTTPIASNNKLKSPLKPPRRLSGKDITTLSTEVDPVLFSEDSMTSTFTSYGLKTKTVAKVKRRLKKSEVVKLSDLSSDRDYLSDNDEFESRSVEACYDPNSSSCFMVSGGDSPAAIRDVHTPSSVIANSNQPAMSAGISSAKRSSQWTKSHHQPQQKRNLTKKRNHHEQQVLKRHTTKRRAKRAEVKTLSQRRNKHQFSEDEDDSYFKSWSVESSSVVQNLDDPNRSVCNSIDGQDGTSRQSIDASNENFLQERIISAPERITGVGKIEKELSVTNVVTDFNNPSKNNITKGNCNEQDNNPSLGNFSNNIISSGNPRQLHNDRDGCNVVNSIKKETTHQDALDKQPPVEGISFRGPHDGSKTSPSPVKQLDHAQQPIKQQDALREQQSNDNNDKEKGLDDQLSTWTRYVLIVLIKVVQSLSHCPGQ